MGVEVLVISQKYFNEYANGVNFTDNLGDYTNNFTGSVMENQMVRMVLDMSPLRFLSILRFLLVVSMFPVSSNSRFLTVFKMVEYI